MRVQLGKYGCAIAGIVCMWFLLSIVSFAETTLEIEHINNIVCELEKGTEYLYTGNAIKPKVIRLVLEDAEGRRQEIEAGEFEVVSYRNHKEVGQADIEVAIDGYEGTYWIEDAFEIKLGSMKSWSISGVSYQSTKLSWKKVAGADGYVIYRRKQGATKFKKIKTITNGRKTSYTDADKGLSLGTTYEYKACAYRMVDGVKRYSEDTATKSYTMQMPAPVVSKVKKASYNSFKLKWEKVSGATGYTLYRSNSKTGSYQKLTTVENATSYTDTGMEVGKTYYYKVRAYRSTDQKEHYGKYSTEAPAKVNYLTVADIKKFRKVRYVSGGATPSGWDCSGFTQWAVKHMLGKEIPKASWEQAKSGKAVNKKDMSKWKVGDVLVYSSGSRVTHVALYLGDGKMMHALNRRYGTIIQDVNYYETWDSGNRLTGVRRFTN